MSEGEAALLPPDAHGALLSVAILFATLGFWGDRQPWARVVPGALLTVFGPFVCATLGLLPHDAPLYHVFFAYLLPLSIPLLLFNADLSRLFTEIGRTGIAFLIVVVSTCISLGGLLAVFDLGPDAGTIAAAQSAGLIGGSVNVLATLDVMGVASDDGLRVATVAAFFVGASLFMFVLFALASVGGLERLLARRGGRAAPVDAAAADETPVESGAFSALALSRVLGWAAAVVLASEFVIWGSARAGASLGFGGFDPGRYRLLVITVLSLGLASAGPRIKGQLVGAFPVGTYLMYLYLAVIGPFANLALVLAEAPLQLVYVLIACCIQAALAIGLAWVCRIRYPELLVAMMACVTSQGAAVSMAVARGWRDLVTPAVLAGLLGYASASFIAVVFAQVLRAVTT